MRCHLLPAEMTPSSKWSKMCHSIFWNPAIHTRDWSESEKFWRWLIYGALSKKCPYNSCWLLPHARIFIPDQSPDWPRPPYGPIKIVPLLNLHTRHGSNFDLYGSTHLFLRIEWHIKALIRCEIMDKTKWQFSYIFFKTVSICHERLFEKDLRESRMSSSKLI